MSEGLEQFQPQQLLTKSKKDIKKQATEMTQALVKNGASNALHLHVSARKIAEYFIAVADESHDAALKEAEKHGKKHTQYDTEIEIKETGVNWKYDNCNDPELTGLLQQQDALKKKIEARQKFLQTLTQPMEVLQEDGELVKIHPAVRKSTTKVTLSY